MFRTIGRIAVLLGVTGLVAGGIYALVVAHDAAGTVSADRPAEWRAERGGPATQEGDASAHSPGARPREFARRRRGGERRDGHGGHDELSIGRGAAGVLGTSLQLAVGAAVVIGLQRFNRRRQKAQHQPAERA